MNTGASPRHRSRALRVILAILAGMMFAGFFALGTWQVYRLKWKLDLIERVDQRVHGAPAPAPPASQWPHLSAESDDYRPVRLRGVYLPASTTQVLASLERGVGYWVVTPLCTTDGVVLVNRGFIPAGPGGWSPQAAPAAAPADACAAARGAGSDSAETDVVGLIRLTEVTGRLRANEPARNYWYTRDVQAIAKARGLPPVAPYFIDADAASAMASGPVADGQPVGGLTVVSFVNNHLVYALTWYALALMVAGALAWVIRDARKGRPH